MIKTLANAFNIENTNLLKLNDYEIFQDKQTLEKIKNDITFSLIDEVSLGLKETDVHSKIDEYTKSLNLSTLEKQYLYNLIDNEIYGIGPITEVMNDTSVKKIFVNSPSSVYVLTTTGYHQDPSISFINNEHIIKTVTNLARKNNLNISLDEAYITFKTLNDARITLLMPPLVDNPVLTISKTDKTLESIEELIRLGTLTPYMARFLEAAVKAKLNILVCGNKSSGKRTLINTLMNFIPTNERIVYAGLKENISSPHQIVTTNTSDIDVLEALSPSYLIYANKNADTLLKLVNKEQGIISSFDIRKFTLANLVTNVMLENPNMNRDNVIASIYTGFDILVYMEKGNDKKIRVTGIKEVQTSGLKDVFVYKDNTFSLIKESDFTYKKIKNMGNNTLDDIFGV
mgnify:FL=1